MASGLRKVIDGMGHTKHRHHEEEATTSVGAGISTLLIKLCEHLLSFLLGTGLRAEFLGNGLTIFNLLNGSGSFKTSQLVLILNWDLGLVPPTEL